jgi:hypothetical protein
MIPKPDTCPECEKPLDKSTSTCPSCGWDGMNEGDYHSGPHGYSPNTAYPETQYGSGFDEEAEWNQ